LDFDLTVFLISNSNIIQNTPWYITGSILFVKMDTLLSVRNQKAVKYDRANKQGANR
jgi:hypothetical protein